MTARDTYVSSVKTAATTQSAAVQSAVVTAQETVNISGVNNNNNPQRGANAAAVTAIANAGKALIAALQLAEMNKQVSVQSAKDTLRSTGDTAPA